MEELQYHVENTKYYTNVLSLKLLKGYSSLSKRIVTLIQSKCWVFFFFLVTSGGKNP